MLICLGLGLLRWVRESVLSSKAPLRERVKFVLDGDEDGKGKGKKGDACLNLCITKRVNSVMAKYLRAAFPSFPLWNVMPEVDRK